MLDTFKATLQRVAQAAGYLAPGEIEALLVSEGTPPGEAYLMTQAGVLYAAYQKPLPARELASTLPPPGSKP